MNFDTPTSFEDLFKAYKQAKRGGANRNSVLAFSASPLDKIVTLQRELQNRTYRVGTYNKFKVYEPKEREIQSCSFRDAVVQHAVCDNVLLPYFKNIFIFDNYAGQLNKGTRLGRERIRRFFESYYLEHGTEGYILKCDITKYFYNIDHEILKEILGYHVGNGFTYWLCEQFVDSTSGIGLPLGNQISQVFALVYLDGLDHMIKNELGAQYYGRYMDDFYIIHNSREYLRECLFVIRDFVNGLGLELNQKTEIIPFKNGLKFLGFHTYIGRDGALVQRLANNKKRNAQRKYRKMAKLVRDGEMSENEMRESYRAWSSHAVGGGCTNLVKAMDANIEHILKTKKETI